MIQASPLYLWFHIYRFNQPLMWCCSVYYRKKSTSKWTQAVHIHVFKGQQHTYHSRPFPIHTTPRCEWRKWPTRCLLPHGDRGCSEASHMLWSNHCWKLSLEVSKPSESKHIHDDTRKHTRDSFPKVISGLLFFLMQCHIPDFCNSLDKEKQQAFRFPAHTSAGGKCPLPRIRHKWGQARQEHWKWAFQAWSCVRSDSDNCTPVTEEIQGSHALNESSKAHVYYVFPNRWPSCCVNIFLSHFQREVGSLFLLPLPPAPSMSPTYCTAPTASGEPWRAESEHQPYTWDSVSQSRSSQQPSGHHFSIFPWQIRWVAVSTPSHLLLVWLPVTRGWRAETYF